MLDSEAMFAVLVMTGTTLPILFRCNVRPALLPSFYLLRAGDHAEARRKDSSPRMEDLPPPLIPTARETNITYGLFVTLSILSYDATLVWFLDEADSPWRSSRPCVPHACAG